MKDSSLTKVLEGLVIAQITHRRTIDNCITTQVQPEDSKEMLFAKFYEYLATDKTVARITPIVRRLIGKWGVFPIVMANGVFWGSVQVFKKCVDRYSEYSDVIAVTMGVLMTCPGVCLVPVEEKGVEDLMLSGDSLDQAMCYVLKDALLSGSFRAFDALARVLRDMSIRAVPHWLEYPSMVSLIRHNVVPDLDICADAVLYEDILQSVKSCTVVKDTDMFPVRSIVRAARTCGYDVDALLAELGGTYDKRDYAQIS